MGSFCPSFNRSSVRKSFKNLQEIPFKKKIFFNFFKFCFSFFLLQNCKKHQVFSSTSSSTLKYQLYIYEKIITNLLNITCNDFLPSIMFNREVKQLSKRNVYHTLSFFCSFIISQTHLLQRVSQEN